MKSNDPAASRSLLSPGMVRVGSFVLLMIALTTAGAVESALRREIGSAWSGIPLLPNAIVGPRVLIPPRLQENAGPLRIHDRILAVDGLPVDDADAIRIHAASRPVGTPVRYRIERSSGEVYEAVIPTARFERADAWATVLPLFVGATFGLLLGAIPLLANPGLREARLFFLLNVGTSIQYGFLAYDWYITHQLVPWGFLAGTLTLGSWLHLAASFPAPLRATPVQHRVIAIAGHGTAALFFLTYAVCFWRAPAVTRWLDWVAGILVMGGGSLFVRNLVRGWRGDDPRLRQQSMVMLPGAVATMVMLPVSVADAGGWVPMHLPPVVSLAPLWILGAAVAYAMAAHNLFAIDAWVKRALALTLLAIGAVAIYIALFVLLQRWADSATAWAIAGILAVVAGTTLPTISPLRRALEGEIERALFPQQRATRAAIRDCTRAVAITRGHADLQRALADGIARSFTTTTVRLVAGPPDGALDEVGAPDADHALSLSPGDPLSTCMRHTHDVTFFDGAGLSGQRAMAAAEGARALDVHLLVPFPPTAALAGGLLLGPRADGRQYTPDDALLLQTVMGQVVVALENARAWDEVRALEQRLRDENTLLRKELAGDHSLDAIVGRSTVMREVMAQVERVAPTDATVLVVGETGTGKELVVRALHQQSRRAAHPMVKVACAALPETLLESELFGHERGAFTGAVAAKAGRFEVANEGTLFLDDVDTLPLAVQAKLLRALEQGEVQRLGSNTVHQVDVRVVAATNRGLHDEVRAGRFREDLYFRLHVVPIHLPPLRARPDDLPLLVEHFIALLAPKLGRPGIAVSAATLNTLKAHPWPGNVRELRNVIERALIMSDGEVLRLPEPFGTSRAPVPTPDDPGGLGTAPMADLVRAYKVRLIEHALARTGGNQREAAELLGIHRPGLSRMIRELGLRERS
jgi:formate hydrogenlyase transcriptional activator